MDREALQAQRDELARLLSKCGNKPGYANRAKDIEQRIAVIDEQLAALPET
jgi:hypothetical protein